MSSSRIPAFYRMSVAERRAKLAEVLGLGRDERATLEAADALPLEVADIMVELRALAVQRLGTVRNRQAAA